MPDERDTTQAAAGERCRAPESESRTRNQVVGRWESHLDPPHQAKGDDERGGRQDHGDEAAEAQHVLAAPECVGEH